MTQNTVFFFSFSLKTEVSCPVLNPFNIREKPKYAKKRRHTLPEYAANWRTDSGK